MRRAFPRHPAWPQRCGALTATTRPYRSVASSKTDRLRRCSPGLSGRSYVKLASGAATVTIRRKAEPVGARWWIEIPAAPASGCSRSDAWQPTTSIARSDAGSAEALGGLGSPGVGAPRDVRRLSPRMRMCTAFELATLPATSVARAKSATSPGAPGVHSQPEDIVVRGPSAGSTATDRSLSHSSSATMSLAPLACIVISTGWPTITVEGDPTTSIATDNGAGGGVSVSAARTAGSPQPARPVMSANVTQRTKRTG